MQATIRKDIRQYADRREYLKLAVTKRRRAIKLKAILYLGGSCQLCGYDKHPGVLDFHHISPELKSFGISSGGFSRSWKAVKAELNKCLLLCANCHREVELGIQKIPLNVYRSHRNS